MIKPKKPVKLVTVKHRAKTGANIITQSEAMSIKDALKYIKTQLEDNREIVRVS